MEVFWGNEGDSAPDSEIAPMFNLPTPETRKITQITGHTPPSAVLTETLAKKEINVCKAEPKSIPKYFVRDYASGKRNAAACLNEFCQLQRYNYKYVETDPSRPFDLYGRPNFAIKAVVNGVNYRAGEGRNKKDAKTAAAKNALNELLGLNADQDMNVQAGAKAYDMYGRSVSLHNQSQVANPCAAGEYKPIPKPVTAQKVNFLPTPSKFQIFKPQHPFDKIGALAEQKIAGLLNSNLALLAAAQHGAIAEFLIKEDGQPGEVVAVGTGNLCCDGDKLQSDGLVLFDCHAEAVARRAFRRYLCDQVEQWNKGGEARKKCILEKIDDSGLLCLKDSVSVHMYMSRIPKGVSKTQPRFPEKSTEPRVGNNNLAYLQNGGCEEVRLPSGTPFVITASDVTSAVKKMVTMSTADKITKWTVCGLQGSLLSHFMEPLYLSSMTIGFEGECVDCRPLCLTVNGRVDEALLQFLPDMFTVRSVRKIGPYMIQQPSSLVPFFEDSEHLSINWTKGDEAVEVVDGSTGKVDALSPAVGSGSHSRLCKSAFYSRFKHLSSLSHGCPILADNYHLAKQAAKNYQTTKRLLYNHLRERGLGHWISRPQQVDCFDT